MHNRIFKHVRLGVLTLLLIALSFFNYACGPYNRNTIINESCTGVVVKKYINYSNHAAHTLWVQGKGGINDICYITTNSLDSIYLYNKISIGDSLIKKPGSSLYHIKSSAKDYTYEYKYE